MNKLSLWLITAATLIFQSVELNAQCTTGSSTGVNLGAESATKAIAPAATCTYQDINNTTTNGGIGSGSRRTYSGLTAAYYYDFSIRVAASRSNTTLYDGATSTVRNTPVQGATSYTFGTSRTSAIACGTWSSNSTDTLHLPHPAHQL